MKRSYKILIGLALVAVLAATYQAPAVEARLNEVRRLISDLGNGNIPIASTSTTLSNGTVMIGSSSGVAAEQTVSGDITVSNAGVAAIATGVIVNADVNASAAIAHSKFATLTSTSLLVGSSAGVATERVVTGDVTISNTGITTIGAGTVETAMLETELQPSHVPRYGGKVIWSGGTATLNAAVMGTFTSDLMTASISGISSEGGYLSRADIFSNNSVVFGLSTSNVSNDAEVTYVIHRAAP
jgi:hypothetical protein